MTTFSYSTGNPANLTGGTTANMADISGPFTDIRTFLNGANLDFTNFGAVVQSDYTTVAQAAGYLLGPFGAASTFMVPWFGGGAAPSFGSGATMQMHTMHLIPADYALGARSAKYRLRVRIDTNAVAPGSTFTFSLNAVTTTGLGASGTANFVTALGPQLGPVTFAAPAAGNGAALDGGDFTAPAAGVYAIGITNASSVASGSLISITALLQRRTV